MKPALSLLFAVLLPASVFATAQMPERLVYDGKTNAMHTTPLESYFGESNPRPDDVLQWTSTACWRGYIGTWAIVSNQFLLTRLHRETSRKDGDDWIDLEETIPSNKIFPRKDYPVLASWYSGVIRLPQGERLRYVHMGFGSVYERDLYITIKKGRVVATREVDNKGKGATQSTSDLEWVALAEEPVEDDGKWCDGRLLRTASFAPIMNSETNFLTRGIFFAGSTNEPAHLWIPDTPTTKSEYLPLNTLPAKHDGTDGSHVEIQAHFVDQEDHYELHVDQVRKLKPGETMHHPDFKPPNKEIQPTK